jgi:hypothetical protein
MRDFENLKIQFPQPSAQKYVDALFSVRFLVLVYHVRHFVRAVRQPR